MSTLPAIQSGLSGIQSGLQSLNKNAAKIASADTATSSADLTKPLVGLLQDKQQVQISAKVVETSYDLLGSILNIKV